MSIVVDNKLYWQLNGKIGGALSCAGSAYILQDVLRNPVKRTESIYHRIMLGLSAMDIIYTFFTWFIGSWAMPKGSWIWAAGNIITCDIAAFLSGIGFYGSPLYNCSLATFYLLQLKYGWSNRRMKAIEKWLHIVPCLVSLVIPTHALATKEYGPFDGICGISKPYPWGCEEPESEVECIRGANAGSIRWFSSYVICLLATIYVSVSMFVVYRYVRDTERKAAQYNFVARFREQDERKTMKRSRRVMIQGVLYCVAMVLLYIFSFIHVVILKITNNKRIPMLDRISNTLTPLQGVFNVCIYLIPVFRKKLKIYRQRKGNKKEQTKQEQTKVNSSGMHSRLPTGEASSNDKKKTRFDVVVKEEEEEKREISAVQQHTFYPDSNTVEGNGEEDNVHDDHAAIDDDENGSDSSGDDYY